MALSSSLSCYRITKKVSSIVVLTWTSRARSGGESTLSEVLKCSLAAEYASKSYQKAQKPRWRPCAAPHKSWANNSADNKSDAFSSVRRVDSGNYISPIAESRKRVPLCNITRCWISSCPTLLINLCIYVLVFHVKEEARN